MTGTTTPSQTDANALLAELEQLAYDWDQEARDRHIDGMQGSAEALRGCRDELRRIVQHLDRRGVRPQQ